MAFWEAASTGDGSASGCKTLFTKLDPVDACHVAWKVEKRAGRGLFKDISNHSAILRYEVQTMGSDRVVSQRVHGRM